MTDPEMIESLRDPGFAKRVWGYDSYQVDAFLTELRERLEGLDEITSEPAAGSELAGVGEKVEEILRAARAAAEQAGDSATERATEIRRESEEAAEQSRREADEYAERTRRSADEYEASTRGEAEREAKRIREEASTEAEAKVAAAEEEADTMLREARLELGTIQDSIEDLRERRQLVLTSIERLRGSLGSMVGEASQGTREFALGDAADSLTEEEREELTATLDTEGYEVEGIERESPTERYETGDYDTGEIETDEAAEQDWGALGEEETIESEAEDFRFSDAHDTDEQHVGREDR